MRPVTPTAGVILAAITLLPGISPARATSLALDTAVKGTFLYKFVPFVTWPDSAFSAPDSPLVICVAGDDGLVESLKTAVAGERSGARPIAVRAVTSAGGDCRILYASGQDAAASAAVIAAVKGRPVLTVTDLPMDTPGHGVIGFVEDHGHVRFDIDNVAATESGLTISSKLLALARTVKTKGAP